MSSTELLERRVVASLRPRIGEILESVSYRCIEHEAEPADLHDPEFYMGGEVVLKFERGPLFISWDESAGWRTHFSVRTSERSLFLPDARLRSLDGSSVYLWQPHIGSPLLASQVLGWDGVPYAVLLSFSLGSVVVGSASETRLGDGDDLLVRAGDYLEEVPQLEVLWSSRPAV